MIGFHFHPVGIMIIILLGCLTLFLPRKYAAIPIIASALTLTLSQKITLGSLDFFPARVLIVFALVRIIYKDETREFELNKIDKVFLVWVITEIICYTILYGSLGHFFSATGKAYDSLGLYFCFRVLFSGMTFAEIRRSLLLIVPILMILASFMIWEHYYGFNIFTKFGGVYDTPMIRKGYYRAQGPFLQAILAGSAAASMVPVYISLVKIERKKALPIFGIMAVTAILFSAQTSGALMAGMIAVFSMILWRYRNYMRLVRWGLVLTLISIHIYMRAPVWYLMDRISSLTGGSGWYRAELFQQAINHLDEWILIGSKFTAHWMPFSLTEDNADITNQFIVLGLRGGFLPMALFIWIIVLNYKKVGSLVRAFNEKKNNNGLFMWSLGAALTAHIVAFFNVSYFDQTILFYYLLQSIIASGDSMVKNDNAQLSPSPA